MQEERGVTSALSACEFLSSGRVLFAGAADVEYKAIVIRRQARMFLCHAVSATVSESRAQEWSLVSAATHRGCSDFRVIASGVRHAGGSRGRAGRRTTWEREPRPTTNW